MMKKDELRALAEWGARRKLQAIERVIAKYFDEFPEVFASSTVPVLVKAEQREEPQEWAFPAASPNGHENGHRTTQPSGVWTAARRAAASRRMKARLRGRNPKPIGKPGTVSARVYAALQQGSASLAMLRPLLKGVGATTIESAIRRAERHGAVRKNDDGRWEWIAATTNGNGKTPTKRRRVTATKTKGHTRLVGQGKWGRALYEYLEEHGPTKIGVVAKALGTQSGIILSSSYGLIRLGAIDKKHGVYAVGDTPLPALKE